MPWDEGEAQGKTMSGQAEIWWWSHTARWKNKKSRAGTVLVFTFISKGKSAALLFFTEKTWKVWGMAVSCAECACDHFNLFNRIFFNINICSHLCLQNYIFAQWKEGLPLFSSRSTYWLDCQEQYLFLNLFVQIQLDNGLSFSGERTHQKYNCGKWETSCWEEEVTTAAQRGGAQQERQSYNSVFVQMQVLNWKNQLIHQCMIKQFINYVQRNVK